MMFLRAVLKPSVRGVVDYVFDNKVDDIMPQELVFTLIFLSFRTDDAEIFFF